MALNITPPKPEEFETPVAIEEVTVEDVEEARSSFVDGSQLNREAEKAQAGAIIKSVANLPTKSVDFQDAMKAVSTLGNSSVKKSANSGSRILDRASTSARGAKKSGNSNQELVANTLGDLREVISDLTPEGKDISVGKKILGILPGGKKAQKYFQRYESAQSQLNGIMVGLHDGSDSLMRDNADLRIEKQNMWGAMQELARDGRIIEDMDEQITAQIEKLRYEGKTAEANTMDADVRYIVRQRRQDLTTQLAVSVQAYLSLGLIETNNDELIKGVARAQETTMMALRTAVLTAEAMAGQALVLDKIDALNDTTNSLIRSNAKMLQKNTTLIYNQAASSGVSADALEESFSAITSTLDAIDSFKTASNDAMEETANRLKASLNKVQPFVERAREQEIATGGNNQSSIGR